MFELRPTGETDAAGNNFVWIIAKHSGMALTVPHQPRFDKGAQVFQQPLLTELRDGLATSKSGFNHRVPGAKA